MDELIALIKESRMEGVPYRSIGDLIYRHSEKGKDAKEVTEVYSVSNIHGLIKAEEFWGAQVHSEDTSNYNVVRPNMIAYRPAGIDVGTIGLMKEGESGLVSPAYIVFGVKDDVLPQYLMLNLKSSSVVFQINQLKEEGARVKFDFDRWNKIEIPVPSIETQQAIISIIEEFSSYEEALNQELILRRKQYEYYSDQLFGFSDDVTRKKMGDVITVCMCKRIKKDQTSPNGDIPFYKNSLLFLYFDKRKIFYLLIKVKHLLDKSFA